MEFHFFLDGNVIINGISDGETYDLMKGDLAVTFNEGSATLNGIAFGSGTTINQTGNYILIVTDRYNNVTTISFSIIDTTPPTVYGVTEGAVYNSKLGAKTITFNKGTATLNGNAFANGASVVSTGEFSLIVTAASNSTTVHFTYIKYGDVTGDGSIDLVDLSAVKKHLLKIKTLSGAYFSAGDINGEGHISISDLLLVEKNILGIHII